MKSNKIIFYYNTTDGCPKYFYINGSLIGDDSIEYFPLLRKWTEDYVDGQDRPDNG